MAHTPPKRRRRWLEYKKPISVRASVGLGIGIWVIFFGVWELSVPMGWVTELLVPGPITVMSTLYDLIANRGFATDIGVSVLRIVASFAAACLFAVPLGVLMGAFRAVEAFSTRSCRRGVTCPRRRSFRFC